MPLQLEPYGDQAAGWPAEGRHILAQYDADSVVVYRAYRPEIGHFAARNGCFGDGFSLSRMSWIKPGFLWMMHRSAWGTNEGQTVVPAVRITRAALDAILAQAVLSAYDPAVHRDEGQWLHDVAHSLVRAQWDPDYTPRNAGLTRRAIQLGLHGEMLAHYAGKWVVGIEDISPLVAALRAQVRTGTTAELSTPAERVYPVADEGVATRLGMRQAAL